MLGRCWESIGQICHQFLTIGIRDAERDVVRLILGHESNSPIGWYLR